MSSLRLVQGARGLVGRIANNAVMTTSSSSSYSTDKHHGKREYRRQGTDSRVATMASAAAVAAAAITYSYGGKEEKVGGAEIQHKKKTVDKKATLDEITRQEIIAEENRVRQHGNPDKVFNYFASYQVGVSSTIAL